MEIGIGMNVDIDDVVGNDQKKWCEVEGVCVVSDCIVCFCCCEVWYEGFWRGVWSGRLLGGCDVNVMCYLQDIDGLFGWNCVLFCWLLM